MPMESGKRHSKRREWEEWYADAKKFYETYGDLLVPTSYRTQEGNLLGRWIERQRAKYNGTKSMKGTIADSQVEMLEKIGMVWKLENRFPWHTWMAAVKRYYRSHGDLEVPTDYVDGDMALGNWIREQRKRYHFHKLPDRCISDLEEYGMDWGNGRHHSWDEWFEDARQYYEEHGNLLVPHGYRSRCGNLFSWIEYQRLKYSGRISTYSHLTDERIVGLESIGMIWDLQEERNVYWDNMYSEVAAYRKANGKLPVWPKGLQSSNGKRMDYWIFGQKEAMVLGRLSEEKVRRLADIGIFPYAKADNNK